jgi:DNA-binding NarL/FixJ family response regulator
LLSLVADGPSNAEISGQLHVSGSTMNTHVNRAMMKLAARGRTQFAVFAYQSGLARTGW